MLWRFVLNRSRNKSTKSTIDILYICSYNYYCYSSVCSNQCHSFITILVLSEDLVPIEWNYFRIYLKCACMHTNSSNTQIKFRSLLKKLQSPIYNIAVLLDINVRVFQYWYKDACTHATPPLCNLCFVYECCYKHLTKRKSALL